jgi:hypothetical protein
VVAACGVSRFFAKTSKCSFTTGDECFAVIDGCLRTMLTAISKYFFAVVNWHFCAILGRRSNAMDGKYSPVAGSRHFLRRTARR